MGNCEPLKYRGCKIVGFDKLSFDDQEKIRILLERIRLYSNLKFPKSIHFTRGAGGSANFVKNSVRVGVEASDVVTLLVHEIVHTNGYYEHDKSFWRKYALSCMGLGIDPVGTEEHYKRGERYLQKFVNTKTYQKWKNNGHKTTLG